MYGIFLLTTCIVLLFLRTAAATLPVIHSSAVINDTATFPCKPNVNNLVLWDYFVSSSNRALAVFDGIRLHSSIANRYEIRYNATIGQNDLVIHQVRMSDAGLYSCFVDSSRTGQQTRTGNTMKFQLTVFDADPVCTTSLSIYGNSVQESDYIQITCSVNFSGSVLPAFRCLPELSKPMNISTNDSVTYKQVTVASVAINGTTFNCEVFLTDGKQPLTDTRHVWNSQPIVVRGVQGRQPSFDVPISTTTSIEIDEHKTATLEVSTVILIVGVMGFFAIGMICIVAVIICVVLRKRRITDNCPPDNSSSQPRSGHDDGSAQRRHVTHNFVNMEQEQQQMSPALSYSSNSIALYSEIDQQSHEADTRSVPYQSLDEKSLAEIANRPPPVYDHIEDRDTKSE